ncbi:MAG TPA: hypothetical protein VN786_13530, partial [Acidimicrobiales bacterium]|nr:hypothetical protein [Acidimicrobiales bacterium]
LLCNATKRLVAVQEKVDSTRHSRLLVIVEGLSRDALIAGASSRAPERRAPERRAPERRAPERRAPERPTGH